MSDSLQPHGLYSPWNSPGQNTGVGSLSLLQGIFPSQGLNPGSPSGFLTVWATREALYAENLMWNARLDDAQAGIKIAIRNIKNLRYVDNTTLMAESEEELNSLLMKVKEETEKAGLKLNIQKTKIMASSPITLWQTDGETMETVTLYFLGSKITADSDCSYEI